MREIVAADYPMTGREVTRDEAIDAFAGNRYKVEIAREIPDGRADHALHDRRVHRSLPRRPRAIRPGESARSS